MYSTPNCYVLYLYSVECVCALRNAGVSACGAAAWATPAGVAAGAVGSMAELEAASGAASLAESRLGADLLATYSLFVLHYYIYCVTPDKKLFRLLFQLHSKACAVLFSTVRVCLYRLRLTSLLFHRSIVLLYSFCEWAIFHRIGSTITVKVQFRNNSISVCTEPYRNRCPAFAFVSRAGEAPSGGRRNSCSARCLTLTKLWTSAWPR